MARKRRRTEARRRPRDRVLLAQNVSVASITLSTSGMLCAAFGRKAEHGDLGVDPQQCPRRSGRGDGDFAQLVSAGIDDQTAIGIQHRPRSGLSVFRRVHQEKGGHHSGIRGHADHLNGRAHNVAGCVNRAADRARGAPAAYQHGGVDQAVFQRRRGPWSDRRPCACAVRSRSPQSPRSGRGCRVMDRNAWFGSERPCVLSAAASTSACGPTRMTSTSPAFMGGKRPRNNAGITAFA